jgi:hypothetical protein
MGNFFRCEFSKLKEISQVGGLPPVDKFLGELWNLHRVHVPHERRAFDFLPSLDSGNWRAEDHGAARDLRKTPNERVGYMPADVVSDDVDVLQFENRSEVVNISRYIGCIVAVRWRSRAAYSAQINGNNSERFRQWNRVTKGDSSHSEHSLS